MKKKMLYAFCLLVMSLVFSSCGKKASDTAVDLKTGKTTSGSNTIEIPIPNHNTKGLDLGIAKSFSVMAYASITSYPTSNVNGKVGLKPGKRTLIAMNSSTEITGGAVDVYAGDDIGDRQDYLTMAREDLIAAYRDAATRVADKDKLEAYSGNIGGKILPPGIYHWSNGATIPTDLSLEGNSTDVWIFQIDGDLVMSENARINLSGGAVAKNIYWQVSGKVTLGANAIIPGTIMNQLTFEMKRNAQIIGRALNKNGKVIMSQNVITKPEI